MENNFYVLNSFRTEAILVGTDQQEQQSPITNITFSEQNIPLSASVCNLEVKFDSCLTLPISNIYTQPLASSAKISTLS